jgi:hypothetical protein
MAFSVISNPSYHSKIGFTQAQFKKLDDLYCRAASLKILNYRTVDCDFEEGLACYTYYKSPAHKPFAQFIIRKVGPRDMMYEVFVEGKGRVTQSGLFDRAYERLADAISAKN